MPRNGAYLFFSLEIDNKSFALLLYRLVLDKFYYCQFTGKLLVRSKLKVHNPIG